MDFFDNLGNKLTQTGQRAKEAANNLTESVRLTQQIGELNKALQGIYEKLGEQYLTLHGDDPEETMAELCRQAKANQDAVKALQAELQRVKNVQICPECGCENPANVNFCAQCGAKLPGLPKTQPAETVFCPECGAKLAPGTKFCVKCGAKQR